MNTQFNQSQSVQTQSLLEKRLVVALVGVSASGYRSMANGYLRSAIRADRRLPETWTAIIEADTQTNPWWITYRILELNPAPDFVCFSVYCWNAEIVYTVTRLLAAQKPHIRIVLGGPEVGPRASEVLAEHPEIYAIVDGEGERALPSLLYSFIRGGDPSSVPGVVIRNQGVIESGPASQVIEDLDSILPLYTPDYPPATDGSAYLETFRGCPHDCAYCYEGKGVKRIRSFSWDRIAQDINVVAMTPGMQSFSFIDSVFNLTTSRLEKLTKILEPHAQRGIRLHTIEVDIESIDAHQANLLVKAGVASVETGPQTTGCKALKAVNRKLDTEKYRAGVIACRERGIAVEADLIIGLPDDSVSNVLESFRFAVSANPAKIQSSTLHVLPGTLLWDRAEELGLIYDSESPHEIIATRDISFSDLRQLEVFGLALGKFHRATHVVLPALKMIEPSPDLDSLGGAS